jgi:HSP20 family protein
MPRQYLPALTRRCRLPAAAPPRPAPQEGKLKWVERSHGHFRRSFGLPPGAAAEGITAKLADGVMTLTVPKAPAPPKPPVKEIPVA